MIFQVQFQAILMFWFNRSILYNCKIEADSHHLLESIASCNKKIDNVFHYQPSIHKLPGYASKFDRIINFN